MPTCNGPDRGCDITPRETGLTSLGWGRSGTDSQAALGRVADKSAWSQGPALVLLPPP